VPKNVLLAIWGRETAFGTYRLPYNAVRVLATQAYLGKRKEKFREEFLLALKILEEGHVKLADMKSSWAGATGLTQFLPSEFYKYAVDFDRDGRIDIWNSVPDALAAAAGQLRAKGWQSGSRWAYEVRVPENTDCSTGVPEVRQTVREWLAAGFVPAYGRKILPHDLDQEASLLQPEGIYGPAFLTLKNYYVIKEYNFLINKIKTELIKCKSQPNAHRAERDAPVRSRSAHDQRLYHLPESPFAGGGALRGDSQFARI
jgi:lytic murein transglycosylase